MKKSDEYRLILSSFMIERDKAGGKLPVERDIFYARELTKLWNTMSLEEQDLFSENH